jgi:hypothetical protein|tara:strand:- start:523 stop:813 length:291 start_codon:yes stop_codon:yes gene_type:complete
MKDLETYIEEAIKNIRSDRAITTTLLFELMEYIKKSEDRRESVGTIAAKYVETLQRSNEQLVKISGLLQKKTGSEQNLTDEDKSELFDLIKESGNG